jgi:hypothetical protein
MLFGAASHALGVENRVVSWCMVALWHFATRLVNGGFVLVHGSVSGLLKDQGYHSVRRSLQIRRLKDIGLTCPSTVRRFAVFKELTI